jgi:cytochrome b6-f complex iron-sulfur subunit
MVGSITAQEDKPMNRRDFLAWIGVGGLASSLPLALAATTSPSLAQSGSRFITVGTLAQLDAQGQLLVTDTRRAPKKAIVIRDPADRTKFLGRTANCNHENCAVDWKAKDNSFKCKCHGARFALNGSVIQGPATQPLEALEVRIEGQNVLVRVS